MLVYPEALEATVTFVAQHSARRSDSGWDSDDVELCFDADTREVIEDPKDDSWARTNGQAASRSRRYFVANKLRYMWVLTYDPERVSEASRQERGVAMRSAGALVRRLRRELGCSRPYWYSPELHPGGHGWHVNLFVADWLDHTVLGRLWGLGFVWVTDFATDPRAPHGEPLGLCRTPQESWRRASRYGCKYAQKDWSREHVGVRSHRYEVGQNFTPHPVRRWVNSKREALELVRSSLPVGAGETLEVWDSEDAERWNRPPAVVFKW